MFQRGPYNSEIFGPGSPNISKYMDGENKNRGVQIYHDSAQLS